MKRRNSVRISASKFNTIARVLLGLILAAFGSNAFIGFLNFMPMPESPAAAMDFMNALIATGYLMTLVSLLETVIGVLLLINRFVALSLILLSPLSVNIILYHLFLDPAGIGPAAVVTTLNIYLLFVHKSRYEAILSIK